jgi:hypothetical protein
VADRLTLRTSGRGGPSHYRAYYAQRRHSRRTERVSTIPGGTGFPVDGWKIASNSALHRTLTAALLPSEFYTSSRRGQRR